LPQIKSHAKFYNFFHFFHNFAIRRARKSPLEIGRSRSFRSFFTLLPFAERTNRHQKFADRAFFFDFSHLYSTGLRVNCKIFSQNLWVFVR